MTRKYRRRTMGSDVDPNKKSTITVSNAIKSKLASLYNKEYTFEDILGEAYEALRDRKYKEQRAQTEMKAQQEQSLNR